MHSARNVILIILNRNHARLLPPAASGRSIAGSAAFGRAGTCGARNAILMILMRQQELAF